MIRKALALALLLAVSSCGVAPVMAQSAVVLPSGCGTGSLNSGGGYLTVDQAGRLGDSSAPTSNATAALSHASTTALGTSLVAKATPGNLYAFNCTGIVGAAAGYCIAYNGTAAPGAGALTGANVLDFCFMDTTAKGCSLSRIPMAANYSAGIVVLISSAASPYTYTTGVLTGAITADFK